MLSSKVLYIPLLLARSALLSSAQSMGSNQASFTLPAVIYPQNASFPNHYSAVGIYETYGEGVDVSAMLKGDIIEVVAAKIVQEKLGLADGEVIYSSGYTGETAEYAYLKQIHNGIQFVNAVANLALKDGKIVSFGSSFVKPIQIASQYASIQASEAIRAAEMAFPGNYSGYPTKLEYFYKQDGSAALVHTIQIEDPENAVSLEVYVDAHTGKAVGSTNFVSFFKYRIVPLIKYSVVQGGIYDVTNPQDRFASPFGWHNANAGKVYDFTAGNNVNSMGPDGYTRRPKINDDYTYHYDARKEPNVGENTDASVVNAFWVGNRIHDIAYRYGFTETAFNYQSHNFKKGGKEGDPVRMYVQDKSGMNNAYFISVPDGQPGVARFFLFDGSTAPKRDSALDNTMVVHEITHGISNRMVGGGSARCLQSVEARGLGEGWSDAFSDWNVQSSSKIQDYLFAQYSTKAAGGGRTKPYSTNPRTNPLRFRDLNERKEEHDAGEIWANMLHNVHAKLLEKHGFSTIARGNPAGKEGNIVWLHLFMDSFANMPCNPTFARARDAIIQADENRYNGANRCLLWKVFASRGLGMDAKTTLPYKDGSAVPKDC